VRMKAYLIYETGMDTYLGNVSKITPDPSGDGYGYEMNPDTTVAPFPGFMMNPVGFNTKDKAIEFIKNLMKEARLESEDNDSLVYHLNNRIFEYDLIEVDIL